MTSAFALELIAMVPWDDELRGIPSVLQDQPQFGFVVPEQMRKVRAPVRIRLDGGGGYHLLGDAGGILHLDGRGIVTGRTPLPSRRERVIDYACDASRHCVLLEQISDATGRPGNRLRRLAPAGSERWSRTGPLQARDLDFATLRGSFTRLLLDGGGRLYLSAERHGSEVAEIDFATGGVRRVVRQRAGAGTVFLAAGRLLTVFFDESDQRGIAVTDPDGKDTNEWRAGAAQFAWLVHPFGADDHLRLYVWRDGRVARISLRGEVEELESIDGVAVRGGDRQLFTSQEGTGGVSVTGKDGRIVLAAPSGYRLVHVDAQGRYHLFGGEAPGKAGELRAYSPGGHLESSGSLPDNLLALECRVPSYDAWQVDAAGRIIVPVVTPEGVAIIGLRSR